MTNFLLFDLAGIDFPGGCEKYFANLANYLSKSTHVTSVVSPQYRKFMDYIYLLVTGRKLNSLQPVKRNIGNAKLFEITFLSLIPFSRSYKKTKAMLLEQKRIYAKNEFQELAYLYFLLGKNEYMKKVIVGVHTPLFVPDNTKGVWKFLHDLEYKSSFYRKFLEDAYKIHVNNTDYARLLRQHYSVPNKKIIYVPNPIDWNTEYRDKMKKNVFSFLWLGRFTEQKGIDRLENVLALLEKEEWPIPLKIVIGGSGELEPLVRKIAQEYNNVEYKGFISNTLQEYQRTDAVLFTAYYDTFAHAVLEPLSYGIPVVAYDIPGPRDMIENKKNGYLVNSDEEFVMGIRELYERKNKDFEKYKQFRKKISTSTNKKYDKSFIYSQLEKIFS